MSPDAPTPLSAADTLPRPAPALDLGHVRTQCERIRAGFHGLYEWIPLRPMSGSAVARWTELKGPLCRRVLAAIQHRDDPAELARVLPGVEGLTLFVDAVERKGCPAGRVQSARQAIAAFADLIHEGGGSQRRLVAAVREALDLGSAAPVAGEGADAERRRLFEAARGLTGASCETMVALQVLTLSREHPGEVDSLGAFGRLGYRARPGAPPLTTKRYVRPDAGEIALAEPGLEDLQARFGTPDLSFTETQLDAHRVLMTCQGPRRPDEPIDLWNGLVRDHGIVQFEADEQAFYSSVAAIGTPTRTLVHDLWVQTPLARASVLRSGVYRATPDVFAAMDYEQWYDRLPGDPRVFLPGSDLAAGVSPAQAAVLERCFASAGLDPADFVGYRCIVRHPVWMAVYRLTLEFEAGAGRPPLG